MSGARAELRAGAMVWRRELLAYRRSPVRLLVTLALPVVFLFVQGTGLQAAAQAVGGVDYRSYIYPGIVALAIIMPSFLGAGSVVYDREFGFLREMLAAPARRSTILLGKAAGAATVATLHGALLVALAGLVDAPYDAHLVLGLLGLCLLTSFTLVAIGLLVATFVTQFQAYMAIVNLLALPMLLASGAMFPLSGLPTWLAVVTRLDPLAYAVDPMRRIVFARLDFSEPTAQQVWLVPSEPRVTWGTQVVPAWSEVAILALLAIGALAWAIRRFERA
ncbi:MAG: type transporter [Thermoleophilia bacterium]|nr:type transporter [Thermoleophilia bacterium]